MGMMRVSSKLLVATALIACGGGGDGGTGPGGGGGGGGGGVACTAPGGSQVRLCSATFNPTSITINRNGTVTWINDSDVSHNVTFAVAPVEGNIGNHTSGSNTRTFNTAGTFSYSCTNHGGMNGSVTVNP